MYNVAAERGDAKKKLHNKLKKIYLIYHYSIAH
jgi:hypothetical protein